MFRLFDPSDNQLLITDLGEMMDILASSELVLNQDGSIYHLNLHPEELADSVIVVGDPDRVAQVSQHFDAVEVSKQKREFITHTGRIGTKRLSVISTGIGTGNVDIVMTELDALVNIDLETRSVKDQHKSLNIICVGTCGALSPETALDRFVVSKKAIGLDALMHYYAISATQCRDPLVTAFSDHMQFSQLMLQPYLSHGNPDLIEQFRAFCQPGITLTCPGFYGPQGRCLRGKIRYPDFIEKCQQFKFNDETLTNLEMEAASIYAMGELLDHQCCVVKAVMANRALGQFSKNPQATVEKLIKCVLEKL